MPPAAPRRGGGSGSGGAGSVPGGGFTIGGGGLRGIGGTPIGARGGASIPLARAACNVSHASVRYALSASGAPLAIADWNGGSCVVGCSLSYAAAIDESNFHNESGAPNGRSHHERSVAAWNLSPARA